MSENQRERKYNPKRKNYFRGNDYQRRRIEEYLECGLKGFLCTCNFYEDQCKREAYNILNEYSEPHEVEKPSVVEEITEEEDIEESLNKEVYALKAQTSRGSKIQKFQNVKTGVKNCLFIRTTIPDPVPLVVRVLEDIEATKKQKSRYLLRMLPIEITCKASPNNMEEAFKPLVKKHFTSEGKTFSVVYRSRYNNSVARDEVIELLAGLVKAGHPLNRADLDNPELAVLVEIMKGICCIGVLPRYNELKRYNLYEMARASAAAPGEGGGGVEEKGVEGERVEEKGLEEKGVEGEGVEEEGASMSAGGSTSIASREEVVHGSPQPILEAD
ncbi:THUMP domain-containing protein 1 [Hetaerina americana]|uniref:THUMP domain-containing protein 1 n=1 Tax=Hetaerina americana TaxID=62018 RepID=UPI003A7F4734